MRYRVILPLLVFHACLASAAWAQFQQGDENSALLGEAVTQHWRAGVIVTAATGPCRGIVASIPVPIDWPEQEVSVVAEDVSSTARVGEQMVEGTVKLMVVNIRQLPAGRESKALITFEVRRREQLPPQDPSIYQLPNTRKLPRNIRTYLGPSPKIESRHAKIRALAREIGADAETPWKHVETIYDWVRDHVEYKNGPLKGALAALNDGTGDCEELTSLFIAICRAADIPARTVWVPGHCYPEFYLVDGQSKGHWFPCQAAGSRAFGGMPDLRPILQKGDNFRPPQNPHDRQRYMSEHLEGQGGRPKVKFIREMVSP